MFLCRSLLQLCDFMLKPCFLKMECLLFIICVDHEKPQRHMWYGTLQHTGTMLPWHTRTVSHPAN